MIKLQEQINKKEEELKVLKEKLKDSLSKVEETEWIQFKFNGVDYEVQSKLNLKVKYKDIIIPEGCQMMNVLMAGYLFDNKIIKFNDWEWIEHYSKRTRDLGYGCSVASLDSYRLLAGGRLSVDGGWLDGSDGCAFGVRWVRRKKK